jgi:hypothetical protein
MPWKARPTRSIANAVTGAAEQRMLPRTIRIRALCKAAYRPKMDAHWPQDGIKVAEVRVNAVTIQFSWES